MSRAFIALVSKLKRDTPMLWAFFQYLFRCLKRFRIIFVVIQPLDHGHITIIILKAEASLVGRPAIVNQYAGIHPPLVWVI